MKSYIERLLESFTKVLNEPWQATLSGQERIWFLVYDPLEQRKVDFNMTEFETVSIRSEKKWNKVSLKRCFPTWLSKHEYRDDYFSYPKYIVDQLDADFMPFATQFLKSELERIESDHNTITAIHDVSSIYGFARLSDLLKSCDQNFKGRLLIFFPGEFDQNHYRLLNARDGWDYLARPITVQ